MAKSESPRIPTVSADISMLDTTNPALTLTFDNGEVIVIQASQLTVELAQMAMMHGLKQKLVDAAALSRNPETGRSATTDDKFNAVLDVYNRLLAGFWNKPRDESSGPSGGLLFAALCRAYPTKSPEALRGYLDGKTDKEQADLRATPKLATIILAIKAERAAAKSTGSDAQSMLDELNDIE